MKYSIIIPVYNRPEEVNELLGSLACQTLKDFEVLVVEDGSTVESREIVQRWASKLNVKYFVKENTGPGLSRNYAAERSQGEYLIILDSDCVLPTGYIQAIDTELTVNPCQAFGGPDQAHESFSPVQKAINYSMTSFFTTGGIRGGRRKLDKFYPRSFNMGIRADLYQRLNGFSAMRFGEDIDLSIRIIQSGAKCCLFPSAWVWHKRRTDMQKFFRQVFNSGMARINLYKKHPTSLKIVHLLPAVFTLGTLFLFAVSVLYSRWAIFSLCPILCFAILVFLDSSIRNRSARVGWLSIETSFIQLFGYGIGFLCAWWKRCIMHRTEDSQAFRKTFYK